MELRNRRVLITGANGFIGSRLGERLALEEGAQVRGLVRGSTGAVRGLALPHAEMAIGDIVDPGVVQRAVDGCDVLVHCAAMQGGRARLDEYRRVNVTGTLNLLSAASAARVARFIHISTINVHGMPPPEGASADSPLCFKGDFYSTTKAEGERAAWEFATAHSLPLVVVRPACTYGPHSQAWTLTPLERVRRRRPVLIGGGDGICNAVYIDNLVDLILLTLKNDAAVGQSFIGAEGRGVSWREFYNAYARMLGMTRLYAMPQWLAFSAARVFGGLARIDGYPPRIAMSSVHFYSHQVVFNIDKNRRLLGYEPRVSFAQGMARTEEWLRLEKRLGAGG